MALAEQQRLEDVLNPEQFRAATTTEGPLLILAGAGSGKTRVLVHRIAHLLKSGRARAHEIFAVTFTNKAAAEMRHRLEDLIGPQIHRAWIGTFHSMAARILRFEGARLGYTQSFTIYDSDDSKRLIRRLLQDAGIDAGSRGTSLAGVIHEIDQAKNQGTNAEAFVKQHVKFEFPSRKIARLIYPRYQQALRRANAMDFGDLLMLSVELLKHHPEAAHRFQERFQYVLVDEFQDTNTVQYELLQKLVERHGNLAVVGDDDQSIYQWRGAEVANILGFKKRFPEATVVTLEENYRSTSNILSAANSVISRNTNRHAKQLRTDAGPGEPVRIAMLPRGDEEAEMIASMIDRRLDGGESANDFAILYRANAQSRPFEEVFKRYRVPYRLIGGMSFYERLEVKDVLGYLRVTANPRSSADFERIVNVPTRGIGKKTVERLRMLAVQKEMEGAELLFACTDQELRGVGLSAAVVKKLRGLDRLLENLRKTAETESAKNVAIRVVEATKYLEHLERADPASAEDRVANVEELVSSIAEHEEELLHLEPEALEGRTPLQAFLDIAALTTTDEGNDDEARVSLLTLHSAKGLEFPVVFMVGMEEHTFPSRRAIENGDGAIEEERRLCYVGMTRAMRRLYLSAARYRRIYGREEVRRASRFLGDVPPEVVDDIEEARRFGQPSRPVPRMGGPAIPEPPRRDRGGDHVIYDSPPPPPEPVFVSDSGPKDAHFRPGRQVRHNSFGLGVIQAAEGSGPRAKLTIHFESEGVKKVVARFVSLVEKS